MSTKVGDRAPEFELETDGGKTVHLSDYAGRWLVLYFYPRDSTPGCTRQAQAFSEALPEFAKLGAAVLGVSKDSIKSHGAFRDRFALRFPLLSDPGLDVHKAYGAWGMKSMYGKRIEGTIRSTFLISPSGIVARAWSGVKVDGHVNAVLDALRAQHDGGPVSPPRVRAKKGPARP